MPTGFTRVIGTKPWRARFDPLKILQQRILIGSFHPGGANLFICSVTSITHVQDGYGRRTVSGAGRTARQDLHARMRALPGIAGLSLYFVILERKRSLDFF
jgi:hypothetical protein